MCSAQIRVCMYEYSVHCWSKSGGGRKDDVRSTPYLPIYAHIRAVADVIGHGKPGFKAS